MYEVRFKGRWSGSIDRALVDLEFFEDGSDMVVVAVDSSALVALVNRVADLGLVIEGVTKAGHRSGNSAV